MDGIALVDRPQWMRSNFISGPETAKVRFTTGKVIACDPFPGGAFSLAVCLHNSRN